MKTRSCKKILLGTTAAALSATMMLSVALTGLQFGPDAVSGKAEGLTGSVNNVTGTVDAHLSDYFDTSVVQKLPVTVPSNEEISVMIRHDGETISEAYDGLHDSTLSIGAFAASPRGKAVSARIQDKNLDLQRKLKNAGVSFRVGNTYDTLFGGFEVIIRAGEFDKLCSAVKGKANVIVGEVYAECETEVVVNQPNIDEKTGIFDSSDSGYDGSGTVVAILDTGLDYTHSAFDPIRFSGKEVIDTDYIAQRLPQLSASRTTEGLTAQHLYRNAKVPYAYDYADQDADVFPINSEHGTHVAGIIAGKDDEITGVAPNAQLAIMKVFSEKDEGARTSWILAALEDCVTLGVDVINMSLGTSCGFSREEIDDIEVQEIYESIRARGISLVCAASNDYSAGFNSEKNGNLSLTSNPDTATVGSPSTYEAALSVASISGQPTPYMVFNDSIIYFTESSNRAGEPKDFVNEILAPSEESKDFEYVTIPGVGRESDYIGYEQQVQGRIALVKRGQTNFEDKARIAKQYGAVGCIIYNNVSGEITMTVGSIGDYPVCSVSQDDGEMLVTASNGTGTITISRSQTAGPFMSDFSSWGPTPNLGIKPEITAHGGDIYSAVPGQGYDRLSGTSMACPNQAGVTALIRQYVKNNFPEDIASDPVAVTAAVNQLMMSTADIAKNTNGLPFSVRKQGAGLTNLGAATQTPAYIRTLDRQGKIMDKAKLELGDDPDKRGVYTMTIEIVNLKGDELTYAVDAVVMTEGVSQTLTYKGDTTVTEKGYLLEGAEVSVLSVDAGGTQTGNSVTVHGNSTAKVSVQIELSGDDKQYLDDSFKNGMYVEGFLQLAATGGTDVDLNVPYLAFYGDWSRAPLFDIDYFETSKDELDDSIDTLEKTLPDIYATRPVGGLYEDYIVYLGSYAYVQDPASTSKISASRDHIALSNQTGENGGVNSISSLYAGLLRGAKRMVMTITDAVTGEVIYTQTEYNMKKSYMGYPSWVEIDFKMEDFDLKNNTQYLVKFQGYLDYENDGTETNLKNTFEFPFYTDFSAPVVTGVDYTSEYDSDRKINRLYANVSVFDNHYVQGYMPGVIVENEPGSEYTYSLEGFGRYITPAVGGRNTTSVFRVELTDYLDEIKNSYNGRSFMFQVMDYAGNTASYELGIPDDVSHIAFPDFEENGLKLSPNQTYKLEPDIFPEGGTSWAESINYTSSDTDVVRVMGDKLIGVKAGTATITAVANSDETVHTEFTVTVLAEGEEGYHKYDNPVAEDFRLTGYFVNKVFYFAASEDRDLGVEDTEGDSAPFVSFSGSGAQYLRMYPSESIKLQYELKNYFDEDEYKVVYSSSSPNVVKVDQDGTVTALNIDAVTGKPLNLERSAIVSVRLQMKDANGEYKNTNYMQSLSVTVKESYTTNGPYLMSYMGLGDTVEIPAEFGVTEIYQFAFSNYRYIPKDLSAGDVISEEDPYNSKIWFIGDNTIKEVIIPEGVETIQQYAFANLTALEKVVFPSTLKKIQRGAFYLCSKLQTVEFNGKNNLQFVNQDAFSGCTYLTNIDFQSIVAIGDNAFENSGLMRITLPETAQSIGANAFRGCHDLDRVTIRADVVKLGAGAFADCERLTDMEVNASVLPAQLFDGCTNLRTLTLGPAVEVIGQYALRGTNIRTITVDSDNARFERSSDGTYLTEKGTGKLVLVAPATTQFRPAGSDLTTIGAGAFSACETLTTVNIPSVTAVEDYAFAGCTALRAVTLGTLKEVGAYAFYGCAVSALPKFESDATIGDYAFAGQIDFETGRVYSPTFKSVNIPDGMTVGAYAFSANFDLTSVTVGDGVTLGEGCFSMTPYLKTVKIGRDAVLGENAFRAVSAEILTGYLPSGNTYDYYGQEAQTAILPEISALTSLTIGDNATIGSGAFYGAGSYVNGTGSNAVGGRLTSVSLGAGATIGDYAFYNCRYLTSIDLSQVLSIGDYAFAGLLPEYIVFGTGEVIEDILEVRTIITAPSIAKVDLTACTSIGVGAFAWNDDLTEVSLGTDCTWVGDGAFLNCVLLGSIDLSNVTEIGYEAFAGCESLTEVTLGEGARIGAGAFRGDSLLAEVDLGSAVTIGDEAFRGCALTEADLSAATYLGSFALSGNPLENVTLGADLAWIGENPFSGCSLKAFKTTVDGRETTTFDISDAVKVLDGVLYRVCLNGLELVCYPTEREGSEYRVDGETVRIGSEAFYGANLVSVELPQELGAIGSKAFYACPALTSVIFTSINAPILEEQYQTYDGAIVLEDGLHQIDKIFTYAVGLYRGMFPDGFEATVGLAIVPYTMWVFDATSVLYGANFVAEIGTPEGRAIHDGRTLVMVRPYNGTGYDTFIYRQYFDVIANGAAARTQEAIRVMEMIDAFPTSITLSDKATILEIRALYDDLPVLQQGLIENYETLTNAERTIAYLESLSGPTVTAQTVMDRIDALPEEITLEQETEISEIRAQYEQLSDEEKAKVTNLDKLVAAEAKIASLKEGPDRNGSLLPLCIALGAAAGVALIALVAVTVLLLRKGKKAPKEVTPAEETPAEVTPAEVTPAEETPAEETPAEETSAEETPAEETPAEETSAEETPEEKTPDEGNGDDK